MTRKIKYTKRWHKHGKGYAAQCDMVFLFCKTVYSYGWVCQASLVLKEGHLHLGGPPRPTCRLAQKDGKLLAEKLLLSFHDQALNILGKGYI